MMAITTRHPIKIGDNLYPTGTSVTVEQPCHPYLQKHFPGLRFKEGSTYVAVTFPYMVHPTIVDRSQLNIPELPREAELP